MKRVDVNELFTKMAMDVAGRSTCARVQVGAVIVKNQRVISMGWNGVPHGQKHCYDHFKEKFDKIELSMGQWDLNQHNVARHEEITKDYNDNYDKRFEEWINTTEIKEEHHQFAVRNEIHSEMNAMIFAAKNGIATDGSDVYVVWSPCIDCAKALLQAGIKKVFYNKKYERDTRGIDFLQENGVICSQVEIETSTGCSPGGPCTCNH